MKDSNVQNVLELISIMYIGYKKCKHKSDNLFKYKVAVTFDWLYTCTSIRFLVMLLYSRYYLDNYACIL